MGRVRLAERVHQAHDDRVLSFRRFNLRWAPWCLPAAALLLGLLLTDVPLLDIVRYAAYFGLAVLLPGTLVHRALRGSRGNLPEDLGLGGATGLLLLLIGWAATAATGLQAFLPAWPAAIVVLFLAVPRLRGHWLIADRRPVPLRWTWVLAGTMTLVVASLVPFWHNQLLPPAQDVWFQDLGYHLALVHEMTRSMPFQVPQLAGETLRYHYLSDADMAAASMLTGIDPIVVLLRLWLAPIAAITVLVVTALARDLTGGKWWAAVLAAAAGVTGLPLLAWAQGSNPISYYSPSQVYMLPLTGLLLTLAVPAVRGRGLGWAWLLVFPLALACAGAKSSALPPVVFGLIVATGTTLGRRERRRPALTMLGLTLAAMLVGTFLFAGGERARCPCSRSRSCSASCPTGRPSVPPTSTTAPCGCPTASRTCRRAASSSWPRWSCGGCSCRRPGWPAWSPWPAPGTAGTRPSGCWPGSPWPGSAACGCSGIRRSARPTSTSA
ncbi:hypothetical protein [Paractinoplanes durhamensis]|uniref:hypothetical protein n=1 Tax=Paractinoplanes durhamensis TaxID=113563 RepID=UPI00363FF9A8